MFAKRWMLPAAAFAAAGLVAGCSSGGGGAKGSVSGAVKASIAGGSVTETVKAVTPTASGTNSSSATGSYSFTSGQGTFEADTGALIGKVTALVSNGTLYVHLPAAIATAVAGGKAWVSVGLANPPAVPGVGNITALAGGADPSRLLEGLQDGLVAATKTDSTHYVATVDLNKAVSSAPSSRKPLAQSEIKLLGGSQLSDDVTLDSSGRISAIVASVTLSGSAAAKEVITTEYSAYGSSVSVSLPPAGQTVDAAKLLSGQ